MWSVLTVVKEQKVITSLTDELIADDPPKTKPTDNIWPAKRQKMLLKNMGFDVNNMTPEAITHALKNLLNKFHDECDAGNHGK